MAGSLFGVVGGVSLAQVSSIDMVECNRLGAPAEPPEEPVLSARGLVKTFDGVAAVDGVSFDLARGEILGLLGPNGAGKTTTIQLLLGLITPTAGTVQVLGLDLVSPIPLNSPPAIA